MQMFDQTAQGFQEMQSNPTSAASRINEGNTARSR